MKKEEVLTNKDLDDIASQWICFLFCNFLGPTNKYGLYMNILRYVEELDLIRNYN